MIGISLTRKVPKLDKKLNYGTYIGPKGLIRGEIRNEKIKKISKVTDVPARIEQLKWT